MTRDSDRTRRDGCTRRSGQSAGPTSEACVRIKLVSNRRHKRPANADLFMGDTGLEPNQGVRSDAAWLYSVGDML